MWFNWKISLYMPDRVRHFLIIILIIESKMWKWGNKFVFVLKKMGGRNNNGKKYSRFKYIYNMQKNFMKLASIQFPLSHFHIFFTFHSLLMHSSSSILKSRCVGMYLYLILNTMIMIIMPNYNDNFFFFLLNICFDCFCLLCFFILKGKEMKTKIRTHQKKSTKKVFVCN